MTTLPPLILTALLTSEDQAHFDALRREHFPADRNVLGAHLTLFHALPGSRGEDVIALLNAARGREPFDAEVTGVRSLGRGVAYQLESELLRTLRADIAAHFADELTAQDRQKHEFHITVQNKVEPAEARALREKLSEDFEPCTIPVVGLELWRYLGGPWEHLHRVTFEPQTDVAL